MKPSYVFVLCAFLMSAGACILLLEPSGSADAQVGDDIQDGEFTFRITKEYVDAGNWGEVKLVDFTPSVTTLVNVSIPKDTSRVVGSDTEYYNVTAVDFSSFLGEYQVGTVTIPEHVTGVEALDVFHCSAFAVSSDNLSFMAYDGILYSFDETMLLRCPTDCADPDLIIPKEVQTVNSYAFNECTTLHSVAAEAPLSNLHQIKIGAFWDCDSLISADFSSCSDLILIDDEAFYNCSSLETLTISDSLRLIGSEAFFGTAISSFTVTENITFIDSGAFAECTNLTSFVSENSTYYERDGVLYKMVGSDSQMDELVCYPAGRAAASFTIPDKVNHIDYLAFTGCTNLKEVTISKGIAVVEDMAFFDCTSLKKVVLSDSVLVIGWGAFYKCSNLDEIVWNSTVATIESMAFMGTRFPTLVLPDSIARIGLSAFAENPNLTSVTIPENAKLLESYAFDDCPNLKDITLLGTEIVMDIYALSLSDTQPCTVTVHAPQGFKEPSTDVGGTHTKITWDIEGQRPYPYENLIGVAICLIILFGIIRMFRRV